MDAASINHNAADVGTCISRGLAKPHPPASRLRDQQSPWKRQPSSVTSTTCPHASPRARASRGPGQGPKGGSRARSPHRPGRRRLPPPGHPPRRPRRRPSPGGSHRGARTHTGQRADQDAVTAGSESWRCHAQKNAPGSAPSAQPHTLLHLGRPLLRPLADGGQLLEGRRLSGPGPGPGPGPVWKGAAHVALSSPSLLPPFPEPCEARPTLRARRSTCHDTLMPATSSCACRFRTGRDCAHPAHRCAGPHL